ncbi:MAG TPA: amino acid permease [Noviherbaspirillum sp.]
MDRKTHEAVAGAPADGDGAARDVPQQVLGLREAISLIVGIVIGAGIFKAPSMVAGLAGSTAWMFAAWLLGGVISLAGALCYAELATAYSHAGGDYHFLRRAYGRSVSFLFGWARFSVITTGSIALLAFVFGDYMKQILPLPGLGAAANTSLYAAAAILSLSWINLRGMRSGAFTQNWLTLIEIGGLLLLVAGAFTLGNEPVPAQVAAKDPGAASLGMAMVFVLLTYGGWNEAAYISAELRDARRNMVKSMVWSILIITLLYLMVNWAFWRGLGLEGMARSEAVAADLLNGAFGPAGGTIISIIVAISALTSMNATMIVGARTTYAIGRDWPVLAALGAWDGKRGTPSVAMRVQCIVALLLVAVGTWQGSGFTSMVEFTAPVFWLFFLLSGMSLFVLRLREPDTERPFRVPLYPLLPALFCIMCAYMLWSSLSYVSSQSLGGLNAAWIGVAVLLLGCVLLVPMLSRDAQRRHSSIQSLPARRRP